MFDTQEVLNVCQKESSRCENPKFWNGWLMWCQSVLIIHENLWEQNLLAGCYEIANETSGFFRSEEFLD
jgi:hypothetical protein